MIGFAWKQQDRSHHLDGKCAKAKYHFGLLEINNPFVKNNRQL